MKNRIAEALVQRIIQAAQEGAKFKVCLISLLIMPFSWMFLVKVIVAIPEVPGFAGDLKSEGSLKIIMAAQYRTINRGGSSIYEEIRKAGFEP